MLSSRLAFANMRKKKGTSITLILFILLATICLNIGVKMEEKCRQMVSEKEAELSAPDFIAGCIATNYKTKYENYLQEDPRVKKVEKEELVYMPTTKNNKNTLELGALIFNTKSEREIAPFKLVEEDPSVPMENAIYAPIILKGYDVHLGDSYTLVCKGKQYDFVIAGFFETTYYGTSMSGLIKYYVPDEVYQKLYINTGRAILLSVQLNGDRNERKSMIDEFKKEFKDTTDFGASMDSTFLGCLDFLEMEAACLSVLSVFSAILIAFAFVLCIVIFIVIVNRVVEHIEENMQNIGVLQATGYTSKHIMLSIVIEFAILAAVGCSVGTVVSYIVLPLLKGTFTRGSGLVSNYGWKPLTDILCILCILLAILLAAGLAALKITKLPPVKALNKGLKSHNFEKNICPLYKGFGKVHFRIALKNIFNNKKSNIMYSVIIACSMFVIGLAFVVFVNFATDRTMMFQMLGFELSDLQVQVTKQTDAKEFAKELLQLDEVRKTNLSDMLMVNVDDVEVKAITSDDFSQMEFLKTYEGTLPQYENEVVITGIISKLLHKGIGDTVTVSAQGRAKECYVVGIYQSSNDTGYMMIMPYQGVVQIRPQYKIGRVDVYLKDGCDKEEFKRKLRTLYKVAVDDDEESVTASEEIPFENAKMKAEEKISKLLEDYGIDSLSYTVMQDGKVILSGDSFDYKIKDIGDYIEFGNGQLDTFSSMVVVLVGIITIITLVVIGGILSLTIKSMIRKKREEYGIFKAIGYTTIEIVRQISINYALAAFFGVTIGTVAVALSANAVLGLCFVKMGMTHMIFSIPYPILVTIAIVLMAFTYVMAIIKAYKVKKITAYDLLTE